METKNTKHSVLVLPFADEFITLRDIVVWKKCASRMKFMPMKNILQCLPVLKLGSDRNFAETVGKVLTRYHLENHKCNVH